MAETNLEKAENIVKEIESIDPTNIPIEISQSEDPSLILDYTNQLDQQSEQIEDAAEKFETLSDKAFKLRQQLEPQQQQGKNKQTASTKIFNLKKAQNNQSVQGHQITQDNFIEDKNMSDLNFRTSADLYNWLNDNDRVSTQNELLELVSKDKEEIIKSSLEEYYESDLTEEEKLEIAVELWPILPSIVKENSPEVEKNIMDLPYKSAQSAKSKEVIDFVNNINEKIKKQAQFDAKISKVSNKTYNMKKEAQHKSEQNVILYGPSQVRIDPFLRQPISDWSIVERNKGFGAVVGDIWTIDWESIWRGSIMDKYSRPYRDTKTGKWIGGYINKRFEVDSWIPEENNMQLLPGQLRKPYIPSQRTLEARMEAMREKEADKRGYAPASSGKPYNWHTANSNSEIKTSSNEEDKKKNSSTFSNKRSIQK